MGIEVECIVCSLSIYGDVATAYARNATNGVTATGTVALILRVVGVAIVNPAIKVLGTAVSS